MDKMLNSKQQSFDALKYLSPQAAEFVSEAYTLSLYILTGIHVQPCNNLSIDFTELPTFPFANFIHLCTVKNGVLFHWFKYNTLGCCSGFHGNLGCETRNLRKMSPL